MAKDYFNHEINTGDIILYNKSGSNGYHSSFSEGIAIDADDKKKGRVSIVQERFIERYNKEDKTYGSYYADLKNGCNTINLTALGIRENQAYKIGE